MKRGSLSTVALEALRTISVGIATATLTTAVRAPVGVGQWFRLLSRVELPPFRFRAMYLISSKSDNSHIRITYATKGLGGER